MLDGVAIVKVTDEAVPDAGTLPVPVQPVQTYWVLEPPETGEVTYSVTLEPESNQPLTGEGESCGEETVR
jgi:hypothetical protein